MSQSVRCTIFHCGVHKVSVRWKWWCWLYATWREPVGSVVSESGTTCIVPAEKGDLFLFLLQYHQRSLKFSENKMKVLAVFVIALVSVCYAAEEAAPANVPKVYKRLIPADVLRDFPGMCFASTKCATIEPGKSWDLTPFCGRSTCVVSEGEQAGRLLELVEDCGPLPKANPKCKISEKTNRTAPFPECCPIFECEKGVVLEYPELPTAAPAAAETKASEKP